MSRAFTGPESTRVVVGSLGPGLLGGDRIAIEGRVGPGAHLVVETQSATKVYGPGTSRAHVRWTVGADATLELRGEPVLLFARAVYESRIEIDLAPGARLLLADYAAFVELGDARAHLMTTIVRAGKPVLRDALRLDLSIAGGAIATFVSSEPCAGEAETERSRLQAARAPGVAFGVGSTLGGGLFVRATAPRVWDVQRLFDPLFAQTEAAA